MQNGTTTVAGFPAAAAASRALAGQGFRAYPWHVGAASAGHVEINNVMITDSKFHLRWPQESSP
jgi:hypothetical protein